MPVTTVGPHIYTQPNYQLRGIGPDLTITRYTEDCKERARFMQHLE